MTINIKEQLIGNEYFGAAGSEIQLGTALANKLDVFKCNWKFSRDGGAVGAIDLKDHKGDKVVLPAGFLVWDSVILVKTLVTSGGAATLAFAANAANDIKTAEAVATFSANAKVAGIPVGTAAAAVLCTATRNPTLTVATAALTAGELDVFLFGVYQER